jgi:hypothetical protein
VVAAAVASEQVILGTSKGYLLRYYWDEAGNERGGFSVPTLAAGTDARTPAHATTPPPPSPCCDACCPLAPAQ